MSTLVDGFQSAATLVGEQLVRRTGADAIDLSRSDRGFINPAHYPDRTYAAIKMRDDFVGEISWVREHR